MIEPYLFAAIIGAATDTATPAVLPYVSKKQCGSTYVFPAADRPYPPYENPESVTLESYIDAAGNVVDVKLVSGNPDSTFVQHFMDDTRKKRYTPAQCKGKAVATIYKVWVHIGGDTR